jgi:hypothetical protein
MPMSELLKDTKLSLRMFWRSPAFTLAAVSALALGIGANTAIFSIVNAVLLKPVPYFEPDRLVVIQQTSADGPFSAGSPATFQFWREQTSVVQDVAAYRSNIINLTGQGLPEQLRASQVSVDDSRLFGADVARVRRIVVFQGMRLAIVGVVVGIVTSLGLARLISSFLFGVSASDPVVFIASPVVLTLVALVAAWIPARRASRVDPIDAQRYE